MYLKKIEIFGFKSFADKTIIQFEPGVTAIVGPNGCGKSNISDSIRWVLGEKSAKLLRGGKMEDLIFAGTEYRKPLGFAEVSLSFSNEDKLFPLEYDEVVITRRMYRSGESEYALNKTPCRLKDIQDLIMGTGVGSNAYSMVEQGEIDYIIQAKADERRFLIEEAAGISKYKHKKEEALRKLERTEFNLQRVNDILAELEKNIKYAERQAKRAEKFRQHFDDLKRLELIKAEQDITYIKTEGGRIAEEKTVLRQREHEIEQKLSQHQQELHAIEERLREHELSQQQLEEKRYALKSEVSTLTDRSTFNAEKKVSLEERNDNLRRETDAAGVRIAALYEELEQRTRALEAFYTEAAEEEKSLAQALAEREKHLLLVAEKKKALEGLRTESLNVTGEVTRLRNDENSVRNKLVSIKNTQERITQTLERLSAEEADILQKLAISKEEVERILGDYSTTKEHLTAIQQEKSVKEAKISELKDAILSKKGSIQECESTLTALKELAASLSTFKEGTKSLIEEAQHEGSPYCGNIRTVLDVIVVTQGYERAVQSALSECLYAVMATSHQEAQQIVSYSASQNKGSIDVLIIPHTYEENPLPEHHAIKGRASDFVTIKDEKYQGLRSILAAILVVDSMSSVDEQTVHAWSNAFSIVSLEGAVITRDHLLKWRSENEVLSGALVQEERRATLAHDLQVYENELGVLQQDLQQETAALQHVTARVEELSGRVVDTKISLESNEKISASIKDNLAKIQEHKNVLSYEQHEANERETALVKSLDECVWFLKEKEDVLQTLETKITDELGGVQSAEEERERLHMHVVVLEQRCAQVKEKEGFLRNAVEIITINVRNEEETKKKYEAECVMNEKRIQELIEDSAQVQHRIAECESLIADVERDIQNVKTVRGTVTLERDAQFEQANRFAKEYEEKRDQIHALELKEMELSYQEQALGERMLQSYKIEIATFDFTSVNKEGIVSDTLVQDIEDLKKKVESLGTVNMLAIEEYSELRERYTFLNTQKTDLEQAQNSLLEAIRKINRTTKQLFIDVFEQVQKNFQEYFAILFNGGVGQLVLVDEANPLESGIDILVRPPGKKMQNISLYSGGERALTATALLFALFKVKPSPFCLLDEVDAPLDEANIDRFLTVLRQFLNTTQFMIVTHNRKTIKMADTLFGVTMEEAGVSKIVSVRVNDVEKIEHLTEKVETKNMVKTNDVIEEIAEVETETHSEV